MVRAIPSRTRAVALLAACTLLVTSAEAHSGTGLPGGFALGFAHPFSGFDHLLAMVCVGIWGAFLGRPLIYALPIAFPCMMVVGALLGMFERDLAALAVETGISLSVIALGACIALAWRAPTWIAVPIVAAFAAFHGYAHGVMLPSAADPVGFSLGFVLATGLLHVAGIGIGMLNSWRHGPAVTRATGLAIAVAGIGFLHQALAIR